MLTVDNSGRGNCMYYAYSISLLYFLRAKNDEDTTNDIFDKLKLSDDQKTQLKALLSKKPHQEFTRQEIGTIVEPILGKATRDLAADHTKVEFIKDPKSTSLFTAAHYRLEYYFKQLSRARQSQLSELIPAHGDKNPNFTEAEIYRVKGIEKSMQDFAKTIIPEIIRNFAEQWENKERELIRDKGPLTEKDIKFHKTNLLDSLLREKTVEFFLANNDEHLNQYITRLKTDYVWGTEETLMVLHCAIQGERKERNQQQTIDTFYDTQICLHLHRGNRSPFPQKGDPEIILNNSGNVHWTSKIPEIIFDRKVKSDPKKQSPVTAVDKATKAKPQQTKDKEKEPPLDLLLDLGQGLHGTSAFGLGLDLGRSQDDEDQEDSEIDAQTNAAFYAVNHGVPQATEGFVAQLVNAIKALWTGIKNIVSYMIGQKISV